MQVTAIPERSWVAVPDPSYIEVCVMSPSFSAEHSCWSLPAQPRTGVAAMPWVRNELPWQSGVEASCLLPRCFSRLDLQQEAPVTHRDAERGSKGAGWRRKSSLWLSRIEKSWHRNMYAPSFGDLHAACTSSYRRAPQIRNVTVPVRPLRFLPLVRISASPWFKNTQASDFRWI